VRCTALAPGCNLVEVGGVKNHRLILFAAAASVFLAARWLAPSRPAG